MTEINSKAISLQQAVTACTWEMTIAQNKNCVDQWITNVLDSKELIVERTRKGKNVKDDIRPFIVGIDESEINEEGQVVLKAELRTQPRSLRPSEFMKSKLPNLTQIKLCRKKQFIETGDRRLDPLEVGQSLEANMELCSS